MTRKIQQLSDSGARVSYLEEGDGPPLVLIHGVGMNADTWFLQTEQLSRYFRVIAVDMPGHGQSTGFSHPATLKDYVEWLASFLQARKEQRFAIAGHSMGALITAGIAIDYPQLVSHAVVISGVYKRDEAARKAVLQRAKELLREMSGLMLLLNAGSMILLLTVRCVTESAPGYSKLIAMVTLGPIRHLPPAIVCILTAGMKWTVRYW